VSRPQSVSWRDWGPQAFADAGRTDRPVLLDISATWCHWCHVMDEHSYTDPEVARLAEARFVPVRVDTDRRPDVNERYNMGGWPTTAILTPSGDILSGTASYLPADRLTAWLSRTADIYRDRRATIEAELAARRREQVQAADEALAPGDTSLVTLELYEAAAAAVGMDYDADQGGFGGSPKFLLPAAVELALSRTVRGDDRWRGIAAHTLTAMLEGEVYDRAEGGFFRYATRHDWTDPHYEKLTADNAAMLFNLAAAYSALGGERFMVAAARTADYIVGTLRLPDGLYAASQAADEDYYRLDVEARADRPAPTVDPVVIAAPNSAVAVSLLRAGRLLGRDDWVETGLDAARRIVEVLLDDRGRVIHCREVDGASPIGLLADLVGVGGLSAAVYEVAGDRSWLETAKELAHYALEALRPHPGGPLSDVPTEDGTAVGLLAQPRLNFEDNAAAADWLCRLSVLTGDARLRVAAGGILAGLAPLYDRLGAVGAAYPLALESYLLPWTTIQVRPTHPEPITLPAHAAHRVWRPRTAFLPPGPDFKETPAEDAQGHS